MNSDPNKTTNGSPPGEGFADGHNINGRYVVEKPIGAGGMGLTYLAYDADNIKRKLVVKTVLKALSTPAGKTAFLKEGEALGRINHDGVVRLFDKGEDAQTGLPFLIMEFVKGTPLNEIIERGKMDLSKAVRITESIAFALSAAHAEDVLHRDLKPANIMLVESEIEAERVKLIDFGVAKVADSVVGGDTTQFGTFKGTLQYASPEQLSGFQPISGETFNLAALTYEMLTGIRPFQITLRRTADESGDKYLGRCYEQIKNLQKDGAKNPREYNADIPPATAAAILKGLAYESINRYQTPFDYALALKNSLTEKQGDAESDFDVPVKPKKSLLKPILLAAILLSALSAGLLGFAYWRNSANLDQPANSNLQPTPATNEPKFLFAYSFQVQKMKNDLPDGKVFSTADSSQISFGDKFNLIVDSRPDGKFYIVKQTADDFVLIFPAGNAGRIEIRSWHLSNPNQAFWFVWSKNAIDLLEQKSLNRTEVNKFLQKNQSSLNQNGSFKIEQIDGKRVAKGFSDIEVYKLSL